jgi:transposase
VRVTTAFNRVLELPGADVVSVEIGDREIVVGLKMRARRLRCPCGYTTSARYDSRGRRRWRHVDAANRMLWLEAEIRRIDCPSCGVRTEEVPWARPRARHTRDFEAVVGWLTQRADKTTVAMLMRASWEAIDRIVARLVADDRSDDARLDGLFKLGVDEIRYKRGHTYLTIVADHDTGRVVWVAEGRTKAALASFFELLGPTRCELVQAVSMDMTPIYRAAAEEAVPNAVICLDQFHAMKWVNEALEHVYRVTPRAGLDIEAGAKGWSRARTALRYGVEHLNDDQHAFINSLRRKRYGLFRAWELKEAYRDLYKIVDPADARSYLKAWCTRALRSRLRPFKALVKRIRRHFDGLIASVEWGISNSRLEGINAKIRLINNRAHGHRSAQSLANSIYLGLGGIHIQLPTQR